MGLLFTYLIIMILYEIYSIGPYHLYDLFQMKASHTGRVKVEVDRKPSRRSSLLTVYKGLR